MSWEHITRDWVRGLQAGDLHNAAIKDDLGDLADAAHALKARVGELEQITGDLGDRLVAAIAAAQGEEASP